MSKPKYPWLGYVKNMVENHEARLQKIKAWDNDLTKTDLKEAVAVEWAKYKTLLEYPDDGAQRLDLIQAAYWEDEPRNLGEAAALLDIPMTTAKRWHTEFILLVALPFGLIE